MKYQMALSLLAFLASGGCGRGGVTSPVSREATLSASADASSSMESIARSGDFHATKECSTFHRRAGEFCTITSSNLKEIPVGTRVYYLSDAGATSLDTDVILDPPGPGNNTASGHVFLSFTTFTGQVTLDGGTGKFSGIHASVVVTHLTGVNWAWDGTYSYSPPQ
ncbi:MAG: hypothetical protein M3P26_16425 [Gemmatimonadota bacterium]|nr:hypothetical protein [Gemmatimonadota bacterium]